MGGKKGVSNKEKAAAKEKEAAAVKAQAREDADWEAAGEGKKSKAQAKRAAQDESRQEAAAKKLEAKRLAEAEEAELTSTSKKGGGKPTQKVTKYDLDRQKEADERLRRATAAERDAHAKREVAAEDYERLVGAAPDNTENGARNVDEALALLGVEEEKPKMKFSEYSAREMPILKQEKPGLKMPQYKDMIWKKWQRSPENPLNQKAKQATNAKTFPPSCSESQRSRVGHVYQRHLNSWTA
eukprot:TRINITY_DN13629_c0_g1_i5.p1 TRINITY_DN13629_c0_g1~~TRINITY_DN13629_c0_g1_i5.p1  ORF type:complete len:241 (-),score=49.52 TRINITY_DN13629_c0_g1_i5:88-810(-)